MARRIVNLTPKLKVTCPNTKRVVVYNVHATASYMSFLAENGETATTYYCELCASYHTMYESKHEVGMFDYKGREVKTEW